MPAWWKGKGRNKSSKASSAVLADSILAAAAVGEVKEAKGKKKASNFDEALLSNAKGVRGKQQPAAAEGAVVGFPHPQPASLPAPLPSASASASSRGGSSLVSSAASDEQVISGLTGEMRAPHGEAVGLVVCLFGWLVHGKAKGGLFGSVSVRDFWCNVRFGGPIMLLRQLIIFFALIFPCGRRQNLILWLVWF